MVELQVPRWEWWIVVYFFVGGIAGGAYFIASVVELVGAPEDRPIARMGYTLAFPLVLVCGVCLIADLGRPERFLNMIFNASPVTPGLFSLKMDSPISVGAYGLLGFGVFSFLSFVDMLVETGKLPWAPLRAKYSGAPRMIYSVVGSVFGLFLAAYTGVLLAHAQMPAWADTPLLGGLFVASGASTGAAAIALGLALTGVGLGDGWRKLKLTDSVAIILEIVILVVLLVVLGAAAAPLLRGINGVLLLGVTLLLGLLVPLGLQFRASFQGGKTSRNITMLSAGLILLGGFVIRMVIVLAPQGYL
ncbi:MAG: NrfD/PsrC family molybdoenzyme membrane anchor subunit [Thermoflexales bacterium]